MYKRKIGLTVCFIVGIIVQFILTLKKKVCNNDTMEEPQNIPLNQNSDTQQENNINV